VSSNISQSYPYASESEAERAAAIEAIVARFDGLRATIDAETTPLDGGETAAADVPVQWWVYVCPTGDFSGRLHVAGYARERHALYTVCDDCGKTFLR
jgi:hypothetical protein